LHFLFCKRLFLINLHKKFSTYEYSTATLKNFERLVLRALPGTCPYLLQSQTRGFCTAGKTPRTRNFKSKIPNLFLAKKIVEEKITSMDMNLFNEKIT